MSKWSDVLSFPKSLTRGVLPDMNGINGWRDGDEEGREIRATQKYLKKDPAPCKR